LADPALIGVSSGAALAVSLAIVFGETLVFSFFLLNKTFFLPIAAFFGGLVATIFIYRIGKRKDDSNVATMLLAGIAVNAFVGAGIGLMSFIATDAQLRNITFWSLGSLGGATWTSVVVSVPLILISVIFSFASFAFTKCDFARRSRGAAFGREHRTPEMAGDLFSCFDGWRGGGGFGSNRICRTRRAASASSFDRRRPSLFIG